MKKVIFLSFFILGITAIIAQLTIIREAVISFYGNELFIGFVLSFWLIWVALGSGVLAKFFKPSFSSKILVICHFLIPFLFLAEVIFLRLTRHILGSLGQVPDLILSLGYLLLISSSLCLILGLQFTVASRYLINVGNQEPSGFRQLFKWLKEKFFGRKTTNIAYLVSQGYFYETLGLVIGGLIYFYILVYFDAISLFFILAVINLVILIFLVKLKITRIVAASFLVIIIALWLMPGFSWQLQQLTNSWRFAGQKLLETKSSKFGNLAVTKTGDQYNFYESGLLLGSTQDWFSNEDVIHLPLLYHPDPKRILLIGGGFNGALNEILKYPVDSIDYLELDPDLVTVVKPYLPLEILAAQNDKRVNFVSTDGLYFIKTTKQNFDLVILDLPNPTTALLNRFYTIEFFRATKLKLAPEGILAIKLNSLENYYPLELEKINQLIYQSLSKVYPSVIVLPDEKNLYLASSIKLNYDPWPLLNRFNRNHLKNQLVTRDYIYYRLTNDRVAQTLADFENLNEINANQQPIGYWYQNLFWLSAHHPRLAGFLGLVSDISLTKIIITSFILFFAVFYILDVLVKRKERILAALTIVPDFSLLGAEIIFIFLFQAIHGYLYYQLSLIFTITFLGIGLGVWLANFLISLGKVKYAYLIRLYFCISLYFLILALIIVFSPKALELPVFFYWLVFVIGFLVGMEFPLANKFYLKFKLDPAKQTSTIYGADLIGSSLGAIFASIFLLPILGFIQTIILLTLLNFLAFIALFFLRQNFEEE
ncbi:MAG: hypothetical protein WC675_00955 [Patescibacteria group bacterium]|jgi:spermidine synthase